LTRVRSHWIEVRRAGGRRLRASVWQGMCALSAVAALLLGGCAAREYDPGVPWHDPARLETCLFRLYETYPRPVRLTQRIIVRVGRQDFDLLGYLFLKPDGSCHAIALGDMGVELFQFRAGPHGAEVLTRPASVPPEPLSDGVIGDLDHLFGDKRGLPARLVRRPDGRTGLVSQRGNGCLEEYEFVECQNAPVRSIGVRDGRIIREAEYHDPQEHAGLPGSMPGHIHLRNYMWRYEMQITLLEARIGDDDPPRPDPTESH
jgi:hypothetical protein